MIDFSEKFYTTSKTEEKGRIETRERRGKPETQRRGPTKRPYKSRSSWHSGRDWRRTARRDENEALKAKTERDEAEKRRTGNRRRYEAHHTMDKGTANAYVPVSKTRRKSSENWVLEEREANWREAPPNRPLPLFSGINWDGNCSSERLSEQQ